MPMTEVARFQTLFDTLNQGVVFIDRQGKVISINPAASSLLGRPFRDLNEIPSDDAQICALGEDEQLLPVERYPAMVAMRTGSRVQNFVMGIFNPETKQRRWFSVDACPIYESGESEPSGAYGIFTDITERRIAERELRQSKLHLALAQSITSVGSAAVDFRTGKWDWSDETFRIYGVDKGNFTPSADALGNLVHPDDWPELYSNVPRTRAGREPAPVAEYRIKRPDGAERILRRIATTVKDEAGHVSGIVATVQDVTELRMAQRENQALQSQLYHAQRLDALGTLAGGIAHDLNNTLVPVVALSDAMLRSLGAEDPNRPLMELIQEGGQRAAELVAQILAFARREVTEYEIINLREFLPQLLRLIRASVPKSIKIVEDLTATPSVSGNKGQLHQVLLNLFSNAAQAIGDDPGHIYLSTVEIGGPQPDGGSGKHFIQISVADTGSGMSEEVQAHIFEPFFTTKRVGTGSGLGLSVAHGIVASHGGEIRVKSSPGEGSRFDVLLPVAAA
jgi:signal transduction histidine kinase